MIVGYIVDTDGPKPKPAKIAAVQEWPRPTACT